MVRLAFFACGLLASAICAARPMIIHQTQSIDAPPPYYFFGEHVAIDGDWALITAITPSPTPTSPEQTHDARLYHRIDGVWTFDRILATRKSTEYGTYNGFAGVAMKNGVAVIGANPTRVFKRTGDTWAEIAHPFTAPPNTADYVAGELIWDGNALLASHPPSVAGETWGARISRINPDNTWTPLERLSSGDSTRDYSPIHWGFSGNTAVVGTYYNGYEGGLDRYYVFRRSGSTWARTLQLDGGGGEADVRGDEFFFATNRPEGTAVYRNDDSGTVIDHLRTLGESLMSSQYEISHTNDVVIQDGAVFRKNAAGKYEHVAVLRPRGHYALIGRIASSGSRLLSHAWKDYNSANGSALFFELPTTYTPSPVIASGFGNGTSPFTPQAGTFAVATTPSGNRVYRQSSTTGDHRALLGDSDWAEQSIEADITPTAFAGNDRWAGLAVRYLDEDNYYYVTLRSSGVVALKVMRHGAFTTLSQKAIPIVAGRSYHVALQAVNDSIVVRIDGRQIYSNVAPDPISHGRAGVIGYRAAVDYDNVVAAQLGQTPIYDLLYGSCYGALDSERLWSLNGTGSWTCSGETGTRTVTQSSTAGVARALVGTPTDDQVVQARARFTSVNGADRWFGIAARYVDENNYYYLTLRNSNAVSLRKLTNGTITTLGTATLSVAPNTWYNLRLDAVGNELRAFVNGQQILQATDSSHAEGQGGLLTYKIAAEYQDYYAWQP